MSVKYKVENAKLNKKLIGEEATVSKIKPHGPRGTRSPKQPTLRELIVDIQNKTNQQGKWFCLCKKMLRASNKH